jgi:hypothetical protein
MHFAEDQTLAKFRLLWPTSKGGLIVLNGPGPIATDFKLKACAIGLFHFGIGLADAADRSGLIGSMNWNQTSKCSESKGVAKGPKTRVNHRMNLSGNSGDMIGDRVQFRKSGDANQARLADIPSSARSRPVRA